MMAAPRRAGMGCTSEREMIKPTLFCRPRNARQFSGARRSGVLQAAGNDSLPPQQQVFQGVYGPWTVTQRDLVEVRGYRAIHFVVFF